MVHSWAGFNLGTNLVWNLQVFWGFKSHTSSGTSMREVMVLSWHSSGPSSVTQPAPQISTGNFSQEVSPTNLPKKGSFFFQSKNCSDFLWKVNLTGLLFNVSGGTRRLVDSSAFLRSLSIADFFQRLVALLDGLVDSLLFESDLASFLKVFVAYFLLSGSELCDIGVVTFLNVLVSTFQDRILLDGLDGFFFFHTAKASFGIINATAEVNSSLDFGSCISSATFSTSTALSLTAA